MEQQQNSHCSPENPRPTDLGLFGFTVAQSGSGQTLPHASKVRQPVSGVSRAAGPPPLPYRRGFGRPGSRVSSPAGTGRSADFQAAVSRISNPRLGRWPSCAPTSLQPWLDGVSPHPCCSHLCCSPAGRKPPPRQPGDRDDCRHGVHGGFPAGANLVARFAPLLRLAVKPPAR